MRTLAVSSIVAATLLLAGGAGGALTPERTLAASARVLTFDLTGRTVALGLGTTSRECPHVELWRPVSGARHRFRSTLAGCKESPSTGFGLASVAVSGARAAWLTFIGGNERDWQLWTATATSRSPRLLRFAERDVDAPAPIVLGPGTPAGIPFAVEREIVHLGANGAAIFRTDVAAPVRALAAHARGRSGVRVAALLAGDRLVGLDGRGRQLSEQRVPVGATAIALDARLGIAYQVGREVSFAEGRVRLPAGAQMVDLEQGRILWTRAGSLGTTSVDGSGTRLVAGTPASPVLGRLGPPGIAWSRGPAVYWRGAGFVRQR